MNILLVSAGFLILDISHKWNLQYVVSGVSLLSLSIFSRFIHVVYSPLKGSFLHPSVDKHLSSSHFGAAMNYDAINIHVLLLQFVRTYGIMVNLYNANKLISTVAAPFYILSNV